MSSIQSFESLQRIVANFPTQRREIDAEVDIMKSEMSTCQAPHFSFGCSAQMKEGFQVVSAFSRFGSMGSEALRSQNWHRK